MTCRVVMTAPRGHATALPPAVGYLAANTGARLGQFPAVRPRTTIGPEPASTYEIAFLAPADSYPGYRQTTTVDVAYDPDQGIASADGLTAFDREPCGALPRTLEDLARRVAP
jgi:hypothetical protein